MKKTFWVIATIAAMGLGTVTSAAAEVSKPSHRPSQKKTHVVHHAKPAAKAAHSATAKSAHQVKKPGKQADQTAAHKAAPKSHAKPLSRLEKRRA